jgi:hypothetical protein
VDPVKSLSRGEISELMHIAPIRRGMTDAPRSLPFADRLRLVLRAFNDREQQGFPNVIRLFGGIHSAHWALIDGDTRLLLCVVFDGGWHDYLRLLARDTPALLHLIWSNCEGWVPLSDQQDGAEPSAAALARASQRMFEFVDAFQVPLEFWFSHSPRLTVRDVEWLEDLRGATDAGGGNRAQLYDEAMQRARPLSRPERLRQALERYDRGEIPGQVQGAHLLRTAQLGFQRLYPLYREQEYLAAYREAFGTEDGARP